MREREKDQMPLNDNNGKYDDIINLPYYKSDKRPKMPLLDRAAQFSPFSALTGYDTAVIEAARVTDQQTELSDEARAELDRIQHLLEEIIDTEPFVTVTYFLPDDRKAGGKYRTVRSQLVRIDNSTCTILLKTGESIPITSVTRLLPDFFCDTIDE